MKIALNHKKYPESIEYDPIKRKTSNKPLFIEEKKSRGFDNRKYVIFGYFLVG